MRTLFNRKLPKKATTRASKAKRLLTWGVPGLALIVGSAYALHDDSVFELGPGLANPGGNAEAGVTNILGDGVSANGPDWADLFTVNADGTVSVNQSAVAAFGGNAAAFAQDDVSAGNLTDRTVYAGRTSDKNSFAIADWDWGTSSVPAKDDITNVYAYTKIVGGQMLVYAGAEREDPSGSSHIDLEFFQKRVGLDETPPCDKAQCFFTGTKTPGDILVSMDFDNGGALGSVTIRKRNAANNGYDVITTLTAEGCNAGDTACAFNNHAPINGGPWKNFDNHGAEITSLPTNSFTEFGINVTALLGSTPCFSTMQVKTRSSPSFTAELKDFALANFQSCQATAATEIHAGATVGAAHIATDIQNTAVPVGTLVHDKALVTGTVGFTAPTGTVTFKRFGTSNCTGSSQDETVALTVVTPNTATTAGVSAAESSAFAPSAGVLSYRAVYNGDANYPGAINAACEPLTINRVNSAVTTDIRENSASGTSVMNKAVPSGTVVVDVATITGSASLGDPTGQVTFRRFTNGGCSGTFTDEVVTLVADSDPSDGIATATSSQQTMAAPAGSFLSYQVSYGGNGTYNASQSSKCEPICQLVTTTQQP
jgi:hypothetical protein